MNVYFKFHIKKSKCIFYANLSPRKRKNVKTGVKRNFGKSMKHRGKLTLREKTNKLIKFTNS